VQVQVKNGKVYEGVLRTYSPKVCFVFIGKFQLLIKKLNKTIRLNSVANKLEFKLWPIFLHRCWVMRSAAGGHCPGGSPCGGGQRCCLHGSQPDPKQGPSAAQTHCQASWCCPCYSPQCGPRLRCQRWVQFLMPLNCHYLVNDIDIHSSYLAVRSLQSLLCKIKLYHIWKN